MALNPKQRRFVQEYLIDLNAKQAAIRAGYSVRSAKQQGSRLLTYPAVAQAVALGQAEAAERARLTLDDVIAELSLLAFANMRDYMQPGADGDPYLDFSKLTRAQAAALTEVTVEDFMSGRGKAAREVRRIKFKLADKRAALVDLGKHLGGFKERHEHSGALGISTIERRIVDPANGPGGEPDSIGGPASGPACDAAHDTESDAEDPDG